MKKIIASIFFISSIGLFADNYEQTITVEFDSPESANNAQAEILRFPKGEFAAFSSRWDDSSTSHANTAKVFRNAGMKATFYLNTPNELFMKACGDLINNPEYSSIASHTTHHYLLPNILPNMAFREVMLHRAVLESFFDTPVMGFALPGYVTYHIFNPDAPKLVGDIIARSGHQFQPAQWNNNDRTYSLPKGTILSTNLFSINDRNPSEATFKKKVAELSALIEKGKVQPHLTLGVHSWQTPKGVVELERILKANKDDKFWYCSANEYVAYTRQFEGSKIEKIVVNGNCATFKLSRVGAVKIGNDIPLSIRFTKTPKNVKSADSAVNSLGNNIFAFEQNAKYKSPTKIALVENSENKSIIEAMTESKKFAGVKIATRVEKNKIILRIENNSSKEIDCAEVAFRLPPLYKNGVKYEKIGHIAAGNKVEKSVALGKKSQYAHAEKGDALYVAEVDFIHGGVRGRIFATTTVISALLNEPCPRDTAYMLGPIEISKCASELLSEISKPNTVLKDISDSPVEKWYKCYPQKSALNNEVQLRAESAKWQRASAKNKTADTHSRLMALEFIADGSEMGLYLNYKYVRSAYLNGVKLDTKKEGAVAKIQTKKGRNRVVVEYVQSFWNVITTPVNVGSNALDASIKFVDIKQ